MSLEPELLSLEEELKISTRLAKRLRELGYNQASELADVEIPDLLLAGITWSSIKKLITALMTNDIAFRFYAPGDEWNEDRWHGLVDQLVNARIVNWEEVAICVMGELNPPQVGTSTASNSNFQSQFAPRKCMEAVMDWFYSQPGKCARCNSHLHLEVDHIVGKKAFENDGRPSSDADTLDNLQLLCKRCNVTKRDSHRLGGLSFHTAQAALMWILFVRQPKTLAQFKTMCRESGLTMADVRFQEAWAMAEWLMREGRYPLFANEATEGDLPGDR